MRFLHSSLKAQLPSGIYINTFYTLNKFLKRENFCRGESRRLSLPSLIIWKVVDIVCKSSRNMGPDGGFFQFYEFVWYVVDVEC